MGQERRQGTVLGVGASNRISGKSRHLIWSLAQELKGTDLRSGLEPEVNLFGHDVDLSVPWFSHL